MHRRELWLNTADTLGGKHQNINTRFCRYFSCWTRIWGRILCKTYKFSTSMDDLHYTTDNKKI